MKHKLATLLFAALCGTANIYAQTPTSIPDKPEVILVSGGTFNMGNNNGEDIEKPVHSVKLSSYSMGKYPVTVGQYKKFCTATSRDMPEKPVWGWNDKHPMVMVTYWDAVSYCNWLVEIYGGDWRLPTEAEWEYAARGGNKSNGYTYSGDNDMDKVGWYADNAGGQTQSVGCKSPNELGIYDMSGNVWEWCKDWYGDYTPEAQTNPKGAASGSARVLRGGTWSRSAAYCRVVHRVGSKPFDCNGTGGFRVVLTANLYAQTPTIIPDKPEDPIELFNYYITHNQTNEALSILDKVIENDKENPSSYFTKGALLDKLGRQEEAITAYLKAVELREDYIDAYYNLFAIYYNRGVKQFEVAKAVPTNEQARYEAERNKADEQFKKALPNLENAYKYNFRDANMKALLINLYYQLKMTDKYYAKNPLEMEYFLENGKLGFRDMTIKKVIISPIYEDSQAFFDEGLAVVKKNGKYGCIDIHGNVVVDFKYEVLYGFRYGFAKMKLNGKFSFIDKKGREIIPIIYDNVEGGYGDNEMFVQLHGKWGVVDTSGVFVAPIKYKSYKELYELRHPLVR